MYISLIVKTIVLYIYIVIAYRIMGKKEVGELNIVDLIVTILIAELAAISIDAVDSSILISMVPITILVIIQMILSKLTIKSQKIRNFIDGKPAIIIKNGKIVFSEMVKLRYSLDDLISQLREQQITSVEEVKFAVLENNGKLSVFDKNSDYPLPIVLDGVIDYTVLKDINKNANWLYKILNERNLKLEDVFYAFHAKGNTFIIKRKDLL